MKAYDQDEVQPGGLGNPPLAAKGNLGHRNRPGKLAAMAFRGHINRHDGRLSR